MRQQQENPGETFLAEIEKLIDQVLFKASVAGKQIGHEQFRDTMPLVEQADHQCLLDSANSAVRHCAGRGDTQGLACQASLPEEFVVTQNADDCLLALLGSHRELHSAV